jgi:hypothetical protein
MPGNYAKGTEVSSSGTRAEIERTLTRFGCHEFAYMLSGKGAAVMFTYHDRQIRFVMQLPDRRERRFTHQPVRGLPLTPERSEAVYEQAIRERWRALAAGIKAKLAMVEADITTFEDEFMAHTVLPDGHTVSEHVGPRITEAIASNQMPALLPGLGD